MPFKLIRKPEYQTDGELSFTIGTKEFYFYVNIFDLDIIEYMNSLDIFYFVFKVGTERHVEYVSCFRKLVANLDSNADSLKFFNIDLKVTADCREELKKVFSDLDRAITQEFKTQYGLSYKKIDTDKYNIEHYRNYFDFYNN
jgi:hypothetical protein